MAGGWSGRARWHRLALLLALAGCAGGPTCTLVGCTSQLRVQLPTGTTAGTACVAGVCTSEVVEGALLVPLGRGAAGSTVQVTVTLGTTAYEGEVEVERTTPNGEGCGPVCVNGDAAIEQGRVVSA